MTLRVITIDPANPGEAGERFASRMKAPFGAVMLSLREDGSGYNVECYTGGEGEGAFEGELALFQSACRGAGIVIGELDPMTLVEVDRADPDDPEAPFFATNVDAEEFFALKNAEPAGNA